MLTGTQDVGTPHYSETTQNPVQETKPGSGSAGGRPLGLLKQARLHYYNGSFGALAMLTLFNRHCLTQCLFLGTPRFSPAPRCPRAARPAGVYVNKLWVKFSRLRRGC